MLLEILQVAVFINTENAVIHSEVHKKTSVGLQLSCAHVTYDNEM